MRGAYESAGAQLFGPFGLSLQIRTIAQDLRRILAGVPNVRRFRPDVIWLNRAELVIWAQVVGRLVGVPIVCHLRHAPNFRFRWLYRGVRHYLAVSEFTARQWVEWGLPADRVTVLHNAVPESEYPWGDAEERVSAAAELGIAPSAPVALYYGRVVREKGVLTMLDAWDKVLGERAEAVLLIVGARDPSQVEVNARIDAMAAASVKWHPQVDNVIPFLHAADVVVLPTWDGEPFGRVVIEAMLTGRPVIGSDGGGIPEILAGEMTRFRVPPRDPDALASHLTATLDWRTVEPELGRRCREYVVSNFAASDHVDVLEQTLKRYA